MYKILRVGYYWTKLFTDVNAKVRACRECQLFARKQNLPAFPLVLIKNEALFQQWGLKFIGEIHPQSSAQHKWILTATDYFSKWVESIPTMNVVDIVVINFLEENILAIFGCPRKIITNNSQAFKYVSMINFSQKYNIILGYSTTYYSQGNGLAKYSNKSLIKIIKNVLTENKKACDVHLKYALCKNIIKTKREIGMPPFHLIYGLDVILSINIALLVMKLWQVVGEELNYFTIIMNQLIEVK
jgi:hypothetical protein